MLRRLHRVLRDVLNPMINDIDDCLPVPGVRLLVCPKFGTESLLGFRSVPYVSSVTLKAHPQVHHQIKLRPLLGPLDPR